jgi:hypothetical protein
MRFIILASLICSFSAIAYSQPYELKIWNKIRLQDQNFHEFSITTDGVYLDGKKQVEKAYDDVWPISDTADFWDYPDAFYKASSTGHYYLFGTHMIQGICGMSNYAMVYVDPLGTIRVSEDSPNACMGDNPSEIRFSLIYSKGDRHPTWNLSGRLEFDAFTFKWKDLTISRKRKRRT